MEQYSYKMGSGRLGVFLEIYRLCDGFKEELSILLNSKGFEIFLKREEDGSVSIGESKVVCGFDSFVYPGDIQQSEVDFIQAVDGPFKDWVINAIWLCGMLCVQWSAGHSEERMHQTIRETLASWNS